MAQDEKMLADDIRLIRDLIDAYADDEQHAAWMRLQQRLSAAPAQPAPLDEGAAGEPVAWQRLRTVGTNTGWVPVDPEDIPHYRSVGQEIRALYAHPSPTPAADDALRVAVEKALEPFARLEIPKRSVGNAGAYSILHTDIRRAAEALAALKAGGVK